MKMPRKTFGGTLRDTLFEFLIIVIGVLVALGVDAWWQDRQEQEQLRLHLAAIASEIDQNMFSVKNLRGRVIPEKLEKLGRVLEVLENPDSGDIDSDEFLSMLVLSAGPARLWFTQSRYDAVRNADGLRHLDNPELESYITSMYAAPLILLQQVDAGRGDYEKQVSELVPASMASSSNHMRWYVSREDKAPVVKDSLSTEAAMRSVMENRQRLAALARNEVNYATGTWFGLRRIEMGCIATRERIMAHPIMAGVEIQSVDD